MELTDAQFEKLKQRIKNVTSIDELMGRDGPLPSPPFHPFSFSPFFDPTTFSPFSPFPRLYFSSRLRNMNSDKRVHHTEHHR